MGAPRLAAASPRPRGRSPGDPRQLLYVLRTDYSWRSLPRGLPPWITVYASFRRWQRDGTWARRLHDQLRRRERARLGRAETPSAGGLDS